MNNPDTKKTNAELQKTLLDAFNSDDEKVFAQAMTAFADDIQQNIIKEATQKARNEFGDQEIMVKRGLNPLNTKEKEYYNAVIANQGFAGVEELVPKTVFERVFDDLEQAHPLLSQIEFVNTTATTEWVYSKGVNPAWWGKLCDEIKELLDNGFETVTTNLYKLSAYLPVCKAMLDLGPEWLDKYVRTVLAESMYIALEQAIVAGTGKDMPIGIIKDLDTVANGIHADKTPVVLTDLSPETFGTKIMMPLTTITVKKDEEGNVTQTTKRVVNPEQVLMVVSPDDYWGKIYPATTFLNGNGVYVRDVLPLPVKVVQSVAMPTGKMSVGLGKDYFMGVGSTQKIEVSDEYRFVEDERTYLAKQYANGRPKNNESFLYFDISDVPATLVFQVNQVATAGNDTEAPSAG